MRKLSYVLIVLMFLSCDNENAPDCFQRTGDVVRREVSVPNFTRILVKPNVEMVLKQADETSVIIESGANLIDEVIATVVDGRLILENTNDCNLVRDFNQTTIFVTAPNITAIRSATQFDISSDGVLSYSNLNLASEDFNEDAGYTTGTFNLYVNCQKINVVGNNIASFFIRGNVDELSVGFFSGTGRFEGAELSAQEVRVFHRGSNKIIVNPLQAIRGEIRSTGDVIAVNRPEVIEVEEFFTGRLRFE
ncbi:head GIN domain-containing protein [Aquimarina brevivitae]|uniref:Putative autotransporter adhesin-like protein n=1 Tax=Aquimarina brevivitae TaxID=323412 RepID=A0A4Q7NY82_9FLAO|nr:head GIN domain-containing protein [Aquimarina brevivitae]RZS92224.1 putative autotransporter adhesin-like protein [Aquimarina brevivitae]